MFSATACGLGLSYGSTASEPVVCELRLECDEKLDDSPPRKRREARVRFCETPMIREFDVDGSVSVWNPWESCPHGAMDNPCDSDLLTERRLQEAKLNCIRNRRPFRYGENVITQTHVGKKSRSSPDGRVFATAARPLADAQKIESSARDECLCDSGGGFWD